jgi:hypothetical protein
MKRARESTGADRQVAAMHARAWAAYLAAGALATGVYFLLPEAAGLVYYPFVSASAAVAIVFGVRVHRPPRATAWYLVALGLAAWRSATSIGTRSS